MTKTQAQLEALAAAAVAAKLDWHDPKAQSAEIVAVEGSKGRFAVIWSAQDKTPRVYGFVGARCAANPIMPKAKAEAVVRHLVGA